MTPLHHAVIQDCFDVLHNQQFVAKWRDTPDKLGFTALEIAKFLGKYDVFELLGGVLPDSFRLQPNGAKNPVALSLRGFEMALRFHYRPFLVFSSYAAFKMVIHQCPYILRSQYIASENYDWEKTFHREITEGKLAPIIIKWIDPVLGYGAFAAEDIAKGQFIGEYTGVVRQLHRSTPNQNPYCFHYPTKLWSMNYFTIDSMEEGNLARFINHSSKPNLKPLCVVDRKLLHLIFVADRSIKQGEQLTLDYGSDYWLRRGEPISNIK
jgi:hypothetical protein